MVVLIAGLLLTGLAPLVNSSNVSDSVNAVIALKTLDRDLEPVAIEGSQIPDFAGYGVNNIFVWSHRGGEWKQVVFQIDEANGIFSGTEAGPYKNFYRPDDGLMDADDEICFMANETGDRVETGLTVNSEAWAPGADLDMDRYEIEVTDPLNGNKGWAYIFYYSTPPAWNTIDYTAWTGPETNQLYAENYYLDYHDTGSDMDNASRGYFSDFRITGAGGGDDTNFVDRSKRVMRYTDTSFGFTDTRSEDLIETNWTDGMDSRYNDLNGLKDGPVRVLRHYRSTVPLATFYAAEMHWTLVTQLAYYGTMLREDEFYASRNGACYLRDDYRSIDHLASACPMTLYNSNAETATIDGTSETLLGTNQTWDQVSSSHGSYVCTYEPGHPADLPIQQRYIDDWTSSENEGGRTGAESGRYGEHGHLMTNPSQNPVHEADIWTNVYTMWMLPADAPNVGQSYYDNYTNPLQTSPMLQVFEGDNIPPVTTIGSVMVDGVASYVTTASSAGIVTLMATIDDTTTRNSNISSAVWTVGLANFPGTNMSASDGTFNTPVEGVEAALDVSFWAPGIYDIYVYGTDEVGNQNDTSTEHATITITDDMPPATYEVLVDGLSYYTIYKSTAGIVNITGVVNDTQCGNSNITSAVWTSGFANFPGTGMNPSDGEFDNIIEMTYYNQDISSWDAGTYEIYVYGTDLAGLQNTTSTVHATIEIIDDVPPGSTNVLVNGAASYSISYFEAATITLTATIDDSNNGNTVIAGANYTVGEQNWGSSQVMDSSTPLDISIEDFTYEVDISGWEPGTYLFYVYGWDNVPNYNTTSQEYGTLVITSDWAPEIKNVLVNGSTSVSFPYSARSSVRLTATVDDTNHGNNTIAGANYTNGIANWLTSVEMMPDTPLDDFVEDFTSIVDISDWVVGTYDLYVYGWDIQNDCNSSSLEYGRVIIYDDSPPMIQNVTINGAEVYETTNTAASTVTLNARVNDTGHGNSIISGANYTIGEKSWGSGANLDPDNALDTHNETFSLTIDVSGWAVGYHYLYVYGWDDAPAYNTTSQAYATLIIHDILVPEIQDVLINGTTAYSVGYADATTIKLTGTIDDTGHGETEIGGANYTDGVANWPTSVPMQSYNDSAIGDVPVVGNVWSDDHSAPNDYRNIMETPDDDRYEYIQEVVDAAGIITQTYDYSSGTGTDKWAYVVDSDSAPSEDTPNSEPELTAAQYTAIGASDDSRYTSPDPGSGDFVSIKGDLYLNEAPSEIDQITLLWEGYVSRAGNVNIYARDQTAGTWTIVAGGSASTADDGTIQGTLSGADWSRYVTGANNEFIYLVQYMVADAIFRTTTMTTDYISATVHYTVPVIEHRWQFNMGSNPTFYIDASNPAGSDSDFRLEWSDDGGTNWNGFSTPIVFTPGEVNILKSSPIILVPYMPGFFVRAISSNFGPNADTFSIDRMWADGGFNNNPEYVYADIDISTWQPGVYNLYVYGWDKTPQYNVTSNAYATLLIEDNVPPEILNFLVDGAKFKTLNLTDVPFTLTGEVNDTLTGNSNIELAGFTDGYQNWDSGILMYNDTKLDSPVETFTKPVDISGWHAGNHTLFMYGLDASGNANDTSKENVTIQIIDNVEPFIEQYSVNINGTFAYWVDISTATTIELSGILNDTKRGYSNIASANWTIDSANWPGSGMSASDGIFNNYTEEVSTIIDISGWAVGSYVFYVYGTDSWGNGNITSTQLATLYIEGIGPEISNVLADSQNPYAFISDNEFKLTADGDDRNTGNSNIVAAEYFVDTIGADGTGTAMSPAGFRFDSPVETAKAFIDCSSWAEGEQHTYYVHFKDAAGYWGDMGSVQVMKETSFSVPVHLGWNLISLPLVTSTSNINGILSGIGWEKAVIYDPLSPQPWLSNIFSRSDALDEFTDINPEMGIWVYVTDIGSGFIDLNGGLLGSASINLYTGWNLVGYTTLTSRLASESLAGTGADMISVYNGGMPYLIEDVTDFTSVTMNPGEAYWVHVPADSVWIIDW